VKKIINLFLTTVVLCLTASAAEVKELKQWCYSDNFVHMPCTVVLKKVLWLEMEKEPDSFFVSDRHFFAGEEYILILSKNR